MLLNSNDFVQYINIAMSYVISMEEKKDNFVKPSPTSAFGS